MCFRLEVKAKPIPVMPNENQRLLKEVKNLKEEIKQLKDRKKYGIVWEEKPEQVVELCKEKLPVLIEDTSKEIEADKNKPVNILIEGDNYHSLSVLNYSHKEKVDLIYIDPPYNTGNKDFIYNDNYVDKEDSFRHSKWLSFMEKRLRLAKNLLGSGGVIFISIDDNEQAQLRMLCDEIFGDENFIANVPRRTKSAGKTTDAFSLNHDYVLVYAKNRQVVKFKAIPINDNAYKYKDEHYSERGSYALSQTLDYDSLSYSDSLDYELKLSNRIYYPGRDKKAFLARKAGRHRASDWTWRWSKELVNFGNKNGFIVIKMGKDGQPRIYTKTYFKVAIEKTDGQYKIIHIDRAKNLTTLDLMESSYSNDIAKKDIRAIFGDSAEFAYPKPVELIKYLINSINGNNKFKILDFFAGSGTTGQAILELNKKDGGTRNFILCTNNENKIAEKVCYPRIKKIISGYKDSDGNSFKGLGGNLKYFKTDFVDAESTDKNKKALVDKSTEMLCLKEDCFEGVKKGKNFNIFKDNKNKYLGIIYDDAGIAPFKNEAKKLNKKFVVYVFSLDDSAREEEFEDIKDLVGLRPIPAVILNIYKRIFK